MANQEKPKTFENKLEQLERLTEQMESGNLSLEELLKVYEEGMQLSNSLQKDLDLAQARLQELKSGKLQQAEEA